MIKRSEIVGLAAAFAFGAATSLAATEINWSSDDDYVYRPNYLTTEEAQEQLDAAFAKIDEIPVITATPTARIAEYKDDDGSCAVAYQTSATPHVYISGRYDRTYVITEFMRVSCKDEDVVKVAIDRSLDIKLIETYNGIDLDKGMDTAAQELRDTIEQWIAGTAKELRHTTSSISFATRPS